MKRLKKNKLTIKIKIKVKVMMRLDWACQMKIKWNQRSITPILRLESLN